MKRWIFFLTVIFTLSIAGLLKTNLAFSANNKLLFDRQHLVYFSNSPQELHVYKIFGRQKGPTVMIVGGIQGDEPGGFLSADLYIDMALKKGNLIIVPRANFQSILTVNRGNHGDMNRKFGLDLSKDPEEEIIAILTNLMRESDLFLNLHDGSGFYRPTWEDDWANPNRYGQSIIADTDVYKKSNSAQNINLQDMALKVIEKVNQEIEVPRHKFHFMNTKTNAPDSKHREQAHSATYYALTKVGIPAFGVETSKQLPSLEMKIYQHNLAVNAFLEVMGVELEQPRIKLEEPKLEYLIISINAQLPVAVPDRYTLLINPGDSVEVVHVGANYERGLSVSFQGIGALNDLKKQFIIKNPTAIIARKDSVQFGLVRIDFIKNSADSKKAPLLISNLPQGVSSELLGRKIKSSTKEEVKVAKLNTNLPVDANIITGKENSNNFQVTEIIIEVNGQKQSLKPNEIFDIISGDKIKLLDFKYNGKLKSDLVLNFKGYTPPNEPYNKGEDRGYLIDTASELIERFSLSANGAKIYEVAVEDGLTRLAVVKVRLVKLELKEVKLKIGLKKTALNLKLGERRPVKIGESVILEEAILKDDLSFKKGTYTLGGRSIKIGKAVTMPDFAVSLAVFEDGRLTGKVILYPVN